MAHKDVLDESDIATVAVDDTNGGVIVLVEDGVNLGDIIVVLVDDDPPPSVVSQDTHDFDVIEFCT